MDRLTGRNKLGQAHYERCFKEPCLGMGTENCNKCDYFTETLCERLAEYEDTNLTPAQIQEIDKLYAEKCKEVEMLKGRIKDLEYACDGHMKIIDNIENANQELSESWVKMKGETEKLKAKLNQITNPSCRCNECKYFSTDGCAEDTM